MISSTLFHDKARLQITGIQGLIGKLWVKLVAKENHVLAIALSFCHELSLRMWETDDAIVKSLVVEGVW